jgi:hypothetical protein
LSALAAPILFEFSGLCDGIPQQITIKATGRRNTVKLTVNAFVGLDGTMQGPRDLRNTTTHSRRSGEAG